MASKLRAGLEQLKKVREGEKRIDQYVVEEQRKIVDEVTEEEYSRIVEERRRDFVVGERSGYDDAGKEVWEDHEAAKEHRKVAAAATAAAAAKNAASSAAKDKECQEDAPQSSESLMKAFGAGARTTGATSSVAPAADGRQDLDSLLSEMCGEMEDVAMPDAAVNATGSQGRPGKRKQDSASGGGRGKKAATRRTKAELGSEVSAKVKNNIKAEAPVKRELLEEPRDVVPTFKGPALAAEMAFERDDDLPLTSELPANVVKAEHFSGETRIRAEPICEDVKSKAEPHEDPMLLNKTLKADTDAEALPAMVSEPTLQPVHAESDGGMWFFMVDAFEDDRNSPPRVYLFGKARTSDGQNENCCLVVERLQRCIHLLLNVEDPDNEPAAEEAARQAEVEFDEICKRRSPGFVKLRAKMKFRNYAFEKPLPNGDGCLPFLKVVYDSAGSPPPANLSGSTFSHVFGAQTSLLERLLTTRRIMGPSWLRLQPGSWSEMSTKLTFCALELRVTPASIFAVKKEEDRRRLSELGMPTTSPPLRVLSLGMQTLQKSAQHSHEPVVVAYTFHPRVSPDATDSERDILQGVQSWAGVRRIDSRPLPRDTEVVLPKHNVQSFNSEASLFAALFAKVQDHDPDVIAGYNAYGFDLDVLASRMSASKIQFWQKLGRLRRPKDRMPRMDNRQTGGFWVGSNITAGRLVCDVLLQARDMLPKLGSYDLPNLALHQLGCKDLREIEPENLVRFYDSAKALVELAERTRYNAHNIARLIHSLQILPLTKQLTCLAGNSWNASLQNKRAERNEYLLCHEFHRKKFVLPDKESTLQRKRRAQLETGVGLSAGMDDAEGGAAGEESQVVSGGRRGKAAYSGGLVLEPKAGLYDDFVMMLDFNSLYPSIIQEHNICFTTVERPDESQVPTCKNEADLLAHTRLPDGMVEEGVLPQVLRRLVESRRTVKAAMKSERDQKRLQTLEIRQKALKLTANSMYGTLGFQNSRFYAKPLAALITAKGREALQSTINIVQQELTLDVIYGDTDSVFVSSRVYDYEQAMQAAQQIKRSVNKRYKCLEIEIDGVFRRLLLLKKKKYAGIKVVNWDKQSYEQELKGLDIVRRDWCGLARELGESILGQILQGAEGKETAVHWIHNYLTEKAAEIDGQKVPLQRYVITKGLTKAPKDYPDAKHQPHVQVALRLTARGKPVTAGQEIEYIICEAVGDEGPKASFAERARHPHEFELDPSLKIDIAWYKTHQLQPVLSRMLACVEGTDAARIAECLGLDGRRFAQTSGDARGNDNPDDAYADVSYVDVAAVLDRKSRWKETSSRLPGVMCPNSACAKHVPWEKVLRPEADVEGVADTLFRCGECKTEVNPCVVQNQLVLQLRKLLKDHCEGWVHCGDELSGTLRTRRHKRGSNETSEYRVFQELEYLEHLCELADSCVTAEGLDNRGCGLAARRMRRSVRQLLERNGFNWVDCGQLFGGIFSQ
mmetsp:Transcript_65722/g.182985  ORF Transcript_65722/g.182985 Transcript_65722/m.182985 type:complete len:1468 (+) Transcript_65722:111-4514(+)